MRKHGASRRGEQREGGAACCVGTRHFARARSQGRRPCIIRSSCQASARARSQVRRSTAPNSDAVRSTGKRGPRFRAPFCGMSVFEGGPARNRVVFINSRRECGKKGPLLESRGADDLALCLQVARGRQTRGSEGSLQEPSADENLPISGRSPQFFCHGSSRGALARASMRKRAERHVRLGGHVRRTRCPALRRIRHLHARPCPHKPDSHVRGNSSTNTAKASG